MNSYRNSEPRPPIMQGSPPASRRRRSDWDRPPWNRWSFLHMREILPTAEVWRGYGPVRILPRADVDLDALPVTDSLGAPTTLAGLLDETYTDGFLVLKHGAIVYERLFNGMTDRTLHLSQSMAKSITAHGVRHTCRARADARTRRCLGLCSAQNSATVRSPSLAPPRASPAFSQGRAVQALQVRLVPERLSQPRLIVLHLPHCDPSSCLLRPHSNPYPPANLSTPFKTARAP